MSEEEIKSSSEELLEEKEVGAAKDCDFIDEFGRRALCKMCEMPVLGAAPFCRDHEAPVP
jgi:hypothetical protein